MDSLFVYITGQSGLIAYAVIFGILVACGLGFPLPEDIPLIAAGYLCWEGSMNPITAFFVTMAGVLLGDTALYFIGRTLGPAILETGGAKAFIKPKRIRKVRVYFHRYGDKLVFFARFVAGLRAAVFFTAGTMKMKYSRFILYDALAGILSVPIWIGIGYELGNYFGDEIGDLLKQLHHLKSWIAWGITLIIASVVTRFVWKYRKAKKLAAASKSKPEIEVSN